MAILSISDLKALVQNTIYNNTTNDIQGEDVQVALINAIDTLDSLEGFVNVHKANGQTTITAYGSKAAARAAVPTDAHFEGVVIAYKLSTGWIIEQNLDATPETWGDNGSWQTVGFVCDSQFELGTINNVTGKYVDNTTGARARSRVHILVKDSLTIIPYLTNIGGVSVLLYDNDEYKGYVDIPNTYWPSGKPYTFTIPERTYNYNNACVVFYSVATSFTEENSNKTRVLGDLCDYEWLERHIERNANEILKSFDISTDICRFSFIQGRWDSTTGNLNPNETVSICCEDFLCGMYIRLNQGYRIQSYCRYSLDGNYIDGVSYPGSPTAPVQELTLPDDGHLYKFTIRNTATTDIEPNESKAAINACYIPVYKNIERVLKDYVRKSDKEMVLNPFYLNVPRGDGIEGSVNISTLTVSQMYGLWDNLIAQYPQFLASNNLGYDESGTYQLRKITFNFAGNSDTAYAKRKVMMIVNIHGPGNSGDSKMQSYLVYYFLKWILDNRYSDTLAEWFIMNYQFVIIPIANPWGYDNNSRGNYNNVDLARNFDVSWVAGESYAGTTCGESAASEVETQMMQSVINDNNDAYMFIDFHSHNENNAYMQILPNSDNIAYRIGKFVRRFCIITANNNIDNYYSTTGGQPKKYAEEIKGIPATTIEAAPYDGTANYTSLAMTDSMRLFLGMLRTE